MIKSTDVQTRVIGLLLIDGEPDTGGGFKHKTLKDPSGLSERWDYEDTLTHVRNPKIPARGRSQKSVGERPTSQIANKESRNVRLEDTYSVGSFLGSNYRADSADRMELTRR